MSEHKFIMAGVGCGQTIFCEKCGLIIFQKNDSKQKIREREEKRLKNISCAVEK